MCIISWLAFDRIFGRHVHHENGEISSSTQRLMGPDFSGYLRDREKHRAVLQAMPFEKIQMAADDGVQLCAHYYQNPEGSKRTAILVHGHNSNGFEGYATVGLDYVREHFNILLPDNRACGESGGRWCTFGIQERYDIRKWIQYIQNRNPEDDIVLHGCSLGAAAVCMCADMDLPHNVKAIVSDCAFSNIKEQLKYMIRVTAHIPDWLILPGVLHHFRSQTGLFADACSPLESVSHAKVPMLFIHGKEDRYVLPDNAEKLYDACASEKQLVMIEGAGHAASRYKGKEKYDQPLFAFLNRYIRG